MGDGPANDRSPARVAEPPDGPRVPWRAPLLAAMLTLAPLLAAMLALWRLLPAMWRQRAARRAALASPPPPDPLPPTAAPPPDLPPSMPVPSAYLPILHQAIERRQPLEIGYQAAEAGTPTTRIIQPLRLEGHADCWYLHAYCTLRRDERVFRVDRITAVRPVRLARPRGRPRRQEPPAPASTAAGRARPRARPAPPRASFFAPPPTPPPGSPLVRVWLAD